jgi:antitoxin PrlF
VRQVLGVGYGARIAFRIENGTVTVHPAEDDARDPALAPFLDLLARDIASRPEALVPPPMALLARIERLTAGVAVDLDAIASCSNAMVGPCSRIRCSSTIRTVGANRFRLFFRADSASRIIVYAWVNDRDTLIKAGATTDPYVVFSGTPARDNPPIDRATLLAAASVPDAMRRLHAIATDPRA